MRLASFELDGTPSWGVVDGDQIVDVGAIMRDQAADLKVAIASGLLTQIAHVMGEASRYPRGDLRLLPVILRPDKILCVGLNCEEHRRETGRAAVGHPTIFTRFANSQVGHGQDLVKPKASDEFDYEGELALVIGKPGRYIAPERALEHVAGYSCYNDASARDWQRHTSQFTPGKNFPATGGFGPWLVTPDDVPNLEALRLSTRVNGMVVQDAGINQMIFDIPKIIAYCSEFTRLDPGDVIVTGTPGGVGSKRNPPLYLKPGDTVGVEISAVGTLINGVAGET